MKPLLSAIALIACFFVNAQSLDLQLREINYSGNCSPVNITKFGTKICFSGYHNSYQESLWLYDEETESIYTISSSGSFYFLKVVGEILYYIKFENGYELWKTDGTEEGTTLVKNFGYNIGLNGLTAYNGKLYFIRYTENYNGEIWVSDGTEEGTHILKDVNPEGLNDNVTNLFVFNNILYFNASSSENGTELWKSDGTEQGTTLFKDIAIGAASSNPGKPIVLDNNFYFLCTTPENGTELWKSDGTPEGTTLFKEFLPGESGLYSYPPELQGIAVQGQYFIFMAQYSGYLALWKSDGTQEGTTELKILNQQTDNISSFTDFLLFNNAPYFVATAFGSTTQIWTTDGTSEGTVMAINSSSANAGTITKFSANENYLIFSGQEGSNLKPWVSDGTQNGTHLLKDINLYSSPVQYLDFVPAGNITYFPAGFQSANGIELWSTDGTEANTKMIKDLSHSNSGILDGRGYLSSVALNNKLIFVGNDGSTGNEPFITDGTEEGTHIIKDIYTGNYSHSCGFTNEQTGPIFTKAGNKVYFNGLYSEIGREIYVTDGTEEGTQPVKDIAPGNSSGVSGYTYFMVYNDIFYFKANDNIHGEELWRTDGTEEGTWMVKDIYPGAQSGVITSNCTYNSIKNYAVLNGFLYFVAEDSTGKGIWKTDGTETGTVKVISSMNNALPLIIEANNNKIFITIVGSNYLYSSDGTQEGTVLIQSGIISNYNFRFIAIVDNQLYYNLETNTTGLSIYRTDGTIAGTVLVKENLPANMNMKFMKACEDYIFFGLGDNNSYSEPYGKQIWRTDGTEEGTFQLAEAESYYIFRDYDCLGSNLIFVNQFSALFTGLSITDGTVANTTLLDINITNAPQFDSENYTNGLTSIFGVIDNKLYLGGRTFKGGNELYVTTVDENYLSTHDNDTAGSKKDLNDIVLYPNPTKEWVNISSNTKSIIYSAEIYDITGKKLSETAINNTEYKLKTNTLTPGIYLVKVKSSNGTSTQKLIKS